MNRPICPECLADLNESIPIPTHGTCLGCGCYFKKHDLTNGGHNCPKCKSTSLKSGTDAGSTYDYICRDCGERFDA